MRGIVIGRCGWPAAVTGRKITPHDMRVSDPAHVELTPMPMVNNAMASVRAVVTMGVCLLIIAYYARRSITAYQIPRVTQRYHAAPGGAVHA